MENKKNLFINTDGGSRGNPGPAAIGVVFYDESQEVLYCCKECIGEATNNEAEYRAIIKALEILLKSRWFAANNQTGSKVVCRLDSLLVVEQINGNYKIKQEHIRAFMVRIHELLDQIKLNIIFQHVPREQNKAADKLVNEALDGQLKA